MSAPDIATVAEMFSGLYDIVAPLPWNGLALTYEARRAGKTVVVAVLPIDAQASPDAADVFEARAKALLGLEHPRLSTVRDYGVRHGVPYLELEFVDAETLGRVVEAGPLDRDRALTITRRILRALELLEAVGIPHLDLTPPNILVEGWDEVRVVGVGIAAILRETRDSDKTGPTGKGSGQSPGRFLAPEILAGDAPDARTDIFSVGALLHFMLTGHPMGKGGPGPPADLVPIIARATSHFRRDRYPRAASMRAAVEAAGGSASVAPPPLPEGQWPPDPSALPVATPRAAPAKRGGRPKGLVIAGVVALAAAVVSVGAVVWMPGADGVSDPAPGHQAEPEPEADPALGADPAAEADPEAGATGADVADGEGSEGSAPGASSESNARASADPLAGDLPAPLDRLWPEVEAGGELTRGDRHLVSRYAAAHQDDARPHVLLARDFMARGWSSDAIASYLAANAADPASSADPSMRDDLLELATRAASNQSAMRAIARIYGRSALSDVEAMLDDLELDAGQRRRLERLERHLRSL